MTGQPGPPPAAVADGEPGELTIADLERATGLGKDLLRKWEQRYGFPLPLRTTRGQRRYSPAQLERLRVVARLIEGGWRPGHLLRLGEPELHALARNQPSRHAMPAAPTAPVAQAGAPRAPDAGDQALPLAREWLGLVAANRHAGLREALARGLAHLGLQTLVTRMIPTFLGVLGEAWQSGRVEVYQEHWASHCVEELLHGALASLPSTTERPAVLLCTPVGERHTMGLLLAECMLRVHGAQALRLGPQLAPRDLGLAVHGLRPDVVAVSVSPHLPAAEMQRVLRELHASLPEGMPLWLGGSHPLLDELAMRLPARRLRRLDQLPEALADWRHHGR